MNSYPFDHEKAAESAPSLSEVLAPHIDGTHHELLAWVMDETGEKGRQLCFARSCGIREGGEVMAAELLTLQPVDLQGFSLDDCSFEAFVFPNPLGGVYTARALEFEALRGDEGWRGQTVRQRLVRFGADLEHRRKGLSAGTLTVEAPSSLDIESAVELERGGRLVAVLQMPVKAGAMEELASQDITATRGIEDFLQKYHRLAQLPDGGTCRL